MSSDSLSILFRNASPSEMLARLADGDPLEIESRSAEFLREEALWIDQRRMTLRALACIAEAGPDWHGDPPPAAWLHARFEDAAGQLLQEELEAVADRIPPERPEDAQLAFLAQALGLGPLLARRACAALNSLPRDVRHTVWDVLIGERTPDELDVGARAPDGTASRHLRQAVNAVREWTRQAGWSWKAGAP